jgi:DtxR family Mn-dependent transcriptional regulator
MTETVDDYLKAIFELGGHETRVSTNSLAARMAVSPASVTGMLRRLARESSSPVDYQKHRGVRLSETGRQRALEMIRHHRLIERFLVDTLGLGWDEVHAQAERLEHAMSESMEDALAIHLGNPLTDPHGAPIPGKDGSLPSSPTVSLDSLEPGDETAIAQVSDHDPALLRYLGGLGLFPRTPVRILEKAPFSGPIKIDIAGQEHMLGMEVCRAVRVDPPVHAQPVSGPRSGERSNEERR